MVTRGITWNEINTIFTYNAHTHTHMHKFAVNLVFQKKDTSISFTEEIKKQSVYK